MKKNKLKTIVLMIITLLLITKNVYADDYPDDIYDGDYSLEEMLQNYNIITFGKKDLDSHMTQSNFTKGNAKIYHINSQFLINGILDVNRIDLRQSEKNLKSFFRNASLSIGGGCGYANGSIPVYDCFIYNVDLSSSIYSDKRATLSSWTIGYYGSSLLGNGNYINFDRLYESILSNQNKIKKGKMINSKNGVAHIEIGGEYYIDDINKIDSIMFDNFENNQNDLTIITINNIGNINFPKIYESTNSGESNLIPTNDYYGMERPNSDYANYYVLDKYYGNIIWNIPNATYIELPSAPFIGHLVAPNADLYGPELHYAGAFLVNSLYLEGNSEAHFYPLTSTKIPYRSNPEPVKAKLNIKRNQGNIKFHNNVNNDSLEEGMVVSFKVEAESNYLLSGMEIKDEEENIIEFKEIGDGEYEFTMPATNVTITPKFVEKNIKNTIEQIITNPKTGNKFFFLLGIIIISSIIGFRKIKKENKI